MSNKKCTICMYNFTKHKRLPISCEHCNVITCLNCFERWLIEDPLNSKIYLCCKQPVNDLIIWRNFTQKSLKLYIEKLARIELEVQKKLMIIIEYKESIKKENKLLLKREKKLRLHLKQNKTDKEAFKELFEVSEKILNNNVILENKEKIEQNPSLKKCLQLNCTGFIIKNKCSVCETMICINCKEVVKENDHICDPNLLKNTEEIKKSTKPCPGCNVPIHKIDGCNQMFCTQCHTAFSWNDGKIIKSKHIHNPHYFEYLANVQNRQNVIYDDNPILNEIINEIVFKREFDLFYIPRLIQECSAIITSLSDFIFNEASLQTYKEQNIKHIIRYKNRLQSDVKNEKVEKRWLSNIKRFILKKFLCTEALDILTLYLQEVKAFICNELNFNNINTDLKIHYKVKLNEIATFYNLKLILSEKKHKIPIKTRLCNNLQCSLINWDNHDNDNFFNDDDW